MTDLPFPVRLVIVWAANIVALWVAAEIVSGIDYGDDFWVLVLAAFVFSAANLIVRPIVTVLAIPLIILTLGIALFFVNLLMLLLTSWIVGDFVVDGFWAAVWGTLIVWFVNWLLEALLGRSGRHRGRGRREPEVEVTYREA